MLKSIWLKINRSRRLAVSLLLLMMVPGTVSLIILGTQIRAELVELKTASSDNIQWNLSQIETDLLHLSNALILVHHDDNIDDSLENVRKRFDIFYSRAQTITDGSGYRYVNDYSVTAQALKNVREYLSKSVAVIDGPDAALLGSIDSLLHRLDGVRADTRTIATEGINHFAILHGKQRTYLSSLLIKSSVLSAVILAALAFVLFILFRQFGITERESKRRQQTAQHYKSLIEASLDAIVVVDSFGKIIDFNGQASKIFGYSKDEAVGQCSVELLVPPKHRKAHANRMRQFRDHGKTTFADAGLMEVFAMRKNGQSFRAELSVASSQGPYGTVFVSFLRDITSRFKQQQQEIKIRDRALAADKAKSKFLAVMSHEMRTPLNGLMGTLELLSDTSLNARQRKFVSVAQTSGNLLLRHVNDVLDISRVEANRLELNMTVFSPLDLTNEVAEVNRASAKVRGNKLTVINRLPKTTKIKTDRFRLGQTLLNLVGNAVKFTCDGTITIEIRRRNGLNSKPEIEFRVIDTGIGIAPENQEQVFDDFVMMDTSYGRQGEGTGLGLGISRRMAEAMGGKLTLSSELGRGSEFTVCLPMGDVSNDELASSHTKRNNKKEKPALLHVSGPSLNVLVVEDNAINSIVAREYLEGMGHTVSEACNGAEGVQAANQQKFDVILMDISMPVMDGLKATEVIRQGNGRSSSSIILGLTAHALPKEQEAFIAAGMQQCLHKPINRIQLSEALAQIQAAKSEQEEAELTEGFEPDSVVIDLDEISELRRLLGDERFLSAVEEFLTEIVDEAPRVQRPNSQEELAEVAALVHKMNGGTGMLGAKKLQFSLHALESCCKLGELDQFDDLHKDLKQVCAQTNHAYRQYLEIA